MSILRKKVGNDIPFTIQMKHNEKLIMWPEMRSLKLRILNDSQLGWCGKCEYALSEDGMTINAIFRGSEASYIGTHRVIVTFLNLDGNVVEVDSPIFIMVKSSSELSHEVVEYELGDESGTKITTEDGLIIKVNADTYVLTNKTIE